MTPAVKVNERPLTILENCFCGGTAGLVSRFFIAPLDVVKIRFQLQVNQPAATTLLNAPQTLAPPLTKAPVKYKSVLQSLRLIAKEEGMKALWKGNWAAEWLYVTYGACQFVAYNQIQRYLNDTVSLPSYLKSTIAGAGAGTCATLATYPLDLLRTRFAAQGATLVYKSIPHAIQQIYAQEGAFGFYRGLWPSILQIAPYMGLVFGNFQMFVKSYDAFNWEHVGIRKSDANIWKSFICGGAAGAISKATVMPLDVVRKRLQIQGPSRRLYFHPSVPSYKSQGFLSCAIHIVRHEGVLALYKGLVPSILKTAPASAITMWTYNICKQLCLKRDT